MTDRSGLAHTVARLYYEAQLSQAEIAAEMGVSSATVSRLLRAARELGIVTIQIRTPQDSGGLSDRLRGALESQERRDRPRLAGHDLSCHPR